MSKRQSEGSWQVSTSQPPVSSRLVYDRYPGSQVLNTHLLEYLVL